MKKYFYLTLTASIFILHALSQDVEPILKGHQSKMDSYTSQTGVLIRQIDFKQPNLLLDGGYSAKTRIRIVEENDDVYYFYQIFTIGKYGINSASIEYSDLLDVINAFENMKTTFFTDSTGSADRIENRYVTDDGFHLGYYIENGKSMWFMQFEKFYEDDHTIFINNASTIETALLGAKNKIESIMSSR